MTEQMLPQENPFASQARELLGMMPVEKIGAYALKLHRQGVYTRDELVGVTRAAYQAHNTEPYNQRDDRKDQGTARDEFPVMVQPVRADEARPETASDVNAWSPSSFASDGAERVRDFREVQFKD